MVVHGHPQERLPNTLSVAFPGVHAHHLLERLGDQVAASPGSACHADKVQVSHVLTAMGVDPATALATIRLSVGRFTTEAEVDRAAELILAEVARCGRVRIESDDPVSATNRWSLHTSAPQMRKCVPGTERRSCATRPAEVTVSEPVG